MTGPAPGRRVLVDADLHLSVDGVDATLVGRGNALTLRTDEPARLTSAFRRSGLIATLRQRERGVAAGRLERSTLTTEGPRGRIARIAPDVRGLPLRAWPAGTRLQVNRPFDLVPAAVGWAVVGTGLAVAWAIHRARRR